MAAKRPGYETPLLLLVAAVLLINVIVLDVIIVRGLGTNGTVLGSTSDDTCPSACITRINRIAGSGSASQKEFYVPLGSGTNASDEWRDVSGASAVIDTGSYRTIRQATFEATVSQPVSSQRVWIRLFNATDKHPVWYSELTTESSGPVLLTSSPITLDRGEKTYQVQIKSQLKGLTNLLQSRIRIVTN